MAKLHRTLGILVLALTFALGWVAWEYQVFLDSPVRTGPEGVSYTVKPGQGVKQIAAQLYAADVIAHPRYFEIAARLGGYSDKIKYGEYALLPGMTPVDILESLASGRVIQYSLTLVEGWTFQQLREAVAAHPVLEQTLRGLSNAEMMEALGRPGEHPEGRFLPDTYHFPRGETDRAFLKRVMQAMDAKLQALWVERAAGLPYESPYEALIMASIVEKETGVVEERRQIAGVFVRRLKKRMRLQTDPTVIYGLGANFDGDIRWRDLKRDTPYNTYTRHGLPPTPIALPGADALYAALHPADGDALYFVAKGDGSHHFSATLKEHNQAVDKYQRYLRRKKR